MLGSAGLIVMDDTTDMVYQIWRLAKFYAHESCAQCTQCREGTAWTTKILERILGGKGKQEDFQLLLDLSDVTFLDSGGVHLILDVRRDLARRGFVLHLVRPQRRTPSLVLDVTDVSHGNAIGVGLADFIPFRILEKIDLRAAYINAMTSGLGGPQRGQLPMAMPTDRYAVAAAILTCGRADPEAVTLVRVHSTLDLEDLLVSESLRAEVEDRPDLEVTGEPRPLRFDDAGQLEPWDR